MKEQRLYAAECLHSLKCALDPPQLPPLSSATPRSKLAHQRLRDSCSHNRERPELLASLRPLKLHCLDTSGGPGSQLKETLVRLLSPFPIFNSLKEAQKRAVSNCDVHQSVTSKVGIDSGEKQNQQISTVYAVTPPKTVPELQLP
uniref:Uncharacterized protein n=1 Tax=Knipowitschia caucasica TaxID=637954 RepID=A0AAV2LMW5_KNICA